MSINEACAKIKLNSELRKQIRELAETFKNMPCPNCGHVPFYHYWEFECPECFFNYGTDDWQIAYLRRLIKWSKEE